MTSREDKPELPPELSETSTNSSDSGKTATDSSNLTAKAPVSSSRIASAKSAAAKRKAPAVSGKAAALSGKAENKGDAAGKEGAGARKAAAPKSDADKPRAAASRARATTRSDTRTTTRKKPAAARPVAVASEAVAAPKERPAASTPAAPAQSRAPAPSPAPAGQQAAANAAAQKSGDATGEAAATNPTAAFVEAAFGPNSSLPGQLVQNIERIEGLTQRLMAALSLRRPVNPGVEGPGADFYATATTAWLKLLAEQPARILGQQVSYWGETLRHFAETQQAMARGQFTPPPQDLPKDRRFSNPLWESHPFFSFVRRQYFINADAMEKAAYDLEIDDVIERRRVEWFTRQIIDMMAPTNFLATNPDALEKAVATEGESLVQGLENLVRDVEQNGGEIVVSLADRNAFTVGENIGTTEGTVVARTHLYELIQYKPSTPQVHAVPVVMFPPWINKYYILDLKPQNSLIKWIVDQGFTLYVVAWKNPDVSYADTGMDDYVLAYLEVMDRIQDLTGEQKVNAVGYCIAGTTLALTLALLKKRGDDRVNSATFFTTLTDFADQGEFTTYLQDDFVDGIEGEVKDNGILPASLMTRTFSFLRANDLVWGPAVRSYMLGETPPAFDLLFWNGDGTNLPGRMAVEYLRGLCQKNAFVGEGYDVLGERVRISDVTLPLCAIACETDHIAPWRDSWRGIAQMASTDRTFVLSESGHIAGIINPPSKKKYGHYTSDAGFGGESEDWLKQGQYHEGSWWNGWGEWLAKRSGGLVEPRDPGEGFGPAPGEFVHERA
ncbi:class I poly(R)-hydroxyalkanoic acid synthase [Paracoccus cavernae]|uniref:class I poly(R)-hydroxyalkanoic acid synthase n=2 Tax=Paracoccus cavernae TaxID=1571207 RepID=UPI0035F30059